MGQVKPTRTLGNLMYLLYYLIVGENELKFKVRVNTEPLEEYLTNIVHELVTLDSQMAQDILRQDLSQRAIWIEPSNNVSKLIDLDLILAYVDDQDEWTVELTLKPVNIHEKNAEIRRRFEERSNFWEDR